VVAPEGGYPAGELIALAEQDGKRLLAGFSQRASVQPPPLKFIQVGKPATEIVKAAQEWPADLIVIGSHGRGGVQRLLLGSVADGVMRHAKCPVLVVRSEE
jgi:nucleotide-binding universal stress UspA family protein